MSDPVARVEHLIRRATDAAASEGEARTCALRACETIRKRELMVVPREEYERLIATTQGLLEDIGRLRTELQAARAAKLAEVTPGPPLATRVKSALEDLEVVSRAGEKALRSLISLGKAARG